MTPQRQKYLFRNAEGVMGDCHRTCIAMILDIDRDDVPHFMDGVDADLPADHPLLQESERQEREWLAGRGLATVSIPYDGSMSLDHLLEQLGWFAHSPVILGCTSGNGVNHSVVVHNGRVFNPNEGTIAGPMRDGRWWVTVYAVGPEWGDRTR